MWSVFFFFLSYLDRNFVKGEFPNYSLDAEKQSKDVFFMLNSTFCVKMSGIGGNCLYQVSDGIEEVRSVHDTSGELVDCSVTINQTQVKSFMHVCRLGLKHQITNPEYMELSFADMTEAKYNCQAFQRTSKCTTVTTERIAAPTAQTPKETTRENSVHEDNKQRSKRGFTYPGTLWCGAGNMADNYDHLGEFAATDSCCRVHDHCPYVIHAFSSKYGYTNFKWHPLSHCDCDNALKECLRKVNDTSSRVVGQAFFNVIEVPCFQFIYEEQCVERHWYGVCKKYDKLPVAVPRESIPYDFGGIDVIDVLTVAPQKETKETGTEQDNPEGTTQSTVSGSQTTGPEEPSLRNMVTVAEDFIKFLATVSTSQGSATDNTKGETQTSEKKKKKNTAGKNKKNNKKRKGKGKGRKRKQKIDSVSKGAEESYQVSPTKAEEVVNKSNFVNEPENDDQVNRNVNRFSDGEKDCGGKEELSNDVMRDEPHVDEESAADASDTSATAVKMEQTMLETPALKDHTETASLSATTSTPIVTTQKTKRQRSRKGEGRKKQSNITPTVTPKGVARHTAIKQDLPTTTTESSGTPTIPTSTAIISADQPAQLKLENHSEKRHVTVTAGTPIVTFIKSKRHRSKEREKTNKWRKIPPTLPMVGDTFRNPTEKDLEVITTESTSAPAITTITTVRVAGQPVSHRPESHNEKGSNTTVGSTLSETKRHRLKEREGRKMRRKVISTLLAEGTSLQNPTEDALHTVTTDSTVVLNIPTITTVVAAEQAEMLTPQSIESHSEKGLLTRTASDPVMTGRRQGSKEREGRKKSKKVTIPTVVKDEVPIHNDNETKLEEIITGTSLTPSASEISFKVDEVGEFNLQGSENYREQALREQTSTHTISPIKSTVPKTEERIGRKKRRKPPQ
ncbi:mediator of DNA damage checkpoint protein 1 [Oncorhynchus mykiss]|uniref:phospholipase A2 n=1 Tax=Oncorhynchus mykiss TaxID=8022 RepID=A0A8C7TL53_ONCMY|nr:mediator of DNA damage checkpoint protein 1 [Oncorhynchus mykiss]